MKAAWLFLLLPMTSAIAGQTTAVSADNAVHADSLAGKIVDGKGLPVGQARADLLDCATMQVTKRSLTDAKGDFLLVPGWETPVYCLRFSMDGFDTVQMRVKLSRSAGKILVELATAT